MTCPATATLANVEELCVKAIDVGYKVQVMFGKRDVTLYDIARAPLL